MFRELRRKNQAVSKQECESVLINGRRGVLSVIGDEGYPYGVPVNFYFDEKENRIYMHGAKAGHKIDAIKSCDKVCFTVWNDGVKEEGDWAPYFTSVIVFGKAELVDDEEVITKKCIEMGRKYYPSEEYIEEEMKAYRSYVQVIAINIEHMSGKCVHEK